MEGRGEKEGLGWWGEGAGEREEEELNQDLSLLEAVITAPPAIKRRTSFPGLSKGADTETKGYMIRQGPREHAGRSSSPKALS